MATADLNRVGAQVVWAIGARASDGYVFAIDDDRFNKQEIVNAIIQAESEIVRGFAEGNHPQREQFLEWLPEDGMTSGDTVPQHIGQIEAVRVWPANASESESEPDAEDYILAEATSRTNIKLWRDNPDIFGENFGYFNLTNQTLTFTGDLAQVKVVAYVPNYEDAESESEPAEDEIEGSLQIDSMWEEVLVSGAIKRLGKDGVPPELVLHHTNCFQTAMGMIRQGLNFRPEIDVEQKLK